MYEEWSDLELTKGDHSVLDRLNNTASKTVAANVVDDLCRQLNTQSSSLISDTEVKWCMQVVCYALGLPFTTDYGTIRNAVRLYCEWLTCVLDEPHPSVPRPLFEQPLYYSREIINHLHHLFLPRSDSLNSDVILRQAKECHHVLRCIQSLILQSKLNLQRELWPEILRFLLSINDALLSPPFDQDDISDQLCERVLSVLFELWIAASTIGHFPSPSYWKTFRTLCHRWRHRVQLIDHWVKILLLLTARKLIHLYGQDYCKMQIADEDQRLVSVDMKAELVVQTWYRVLHLIGNPVELLTNQTFENSPKFRDYINKHGGDSGVLDPSDHPCLVHLPYCFFRAVSGIHMMISGLLGEPVDCSFRGPEKISKELNTLLNQAMTTQANASSSSSLSGTNINQPPALMRAAIGLGLSSGASIKMKDSRSNLQPKATISLNQLSDSVIISAILKASPLSLSKAIVYPSKRPTVESLCKLFGDWLFSVAGAKSDAVKKPNFEEFLDAMSQKSSGSQQSSDAENSLKTSGQTELRAFIENLSSISGFQAGKAEAVAALCKLFSFKDSKEVLPEFLLAKFYSALLDTLLDNDNVISGYLIFHAVNLFRVGLRGIELLIPHFLDCLDVLCVESDKTKIHPSLTDIELRRAVLHLLSSLICVPTFYGISSFMDVNRNTEQHTFIGLRPKMIRILLHELKIETDSLNLQMCMSLISLFCQACWLWECNAGSLHNEVYYGEAIHSVLLPICESLSGKWNSDFGVCVAALDCLCSLTCVQSKRKNQDSTNMDEVVLYLCKFVEVQLSKPPPAHSRDMHSTVVAAFYCLETWLVSMPKLLQSELCLQKVAEVIQLGVTGAKAESQENDGDIARKPASQRVHDAAEQLLHTLFNRVGIAFGMCDAPEDEDYLIRKLVEMNGKDSHNDRLKFSYVFADGAFIFALANANLKNNLSSSALVLRSPFTCATSWTFSFRHRQNEKVNPPDLVSRPIGEDRPKMIHPTSVFFPPEIEKVEKCRIDASIPELDITPELEKMKVLLKKVCQKNVIKEINYENNDVKPEVLGDRVDASKILLQTFGYFDVGDGQAKCLLLRSDNDEFKNELKCLDACPSRFIQTLHVFYVKDGKTSAVDILQNGMEPEIVSHQFCEFLSTLGVGINVQTSRLWTGHWSTAYHNGLDAGDYVNQTQDGKHFVLDGLSHALYWASPLVEMAFLVPTIRSYKLANRSRARSSPRESFELRPSDAGLLTDRAIDANRRWSQSCQTFETHDEHLENSFSASLDNNPNYFGSSSSGPQFKQKSARLKTVMNFNRKKESTSSVGYNFLESDEDVLTTTANLSSSSHVAGATGDSLSAHPVPPPRSKSVSHNDEMLNLNGSSRTATHPPSKKRTFLYQDYRFLIVWLECFEDHVRFPRDELLIVTDLGEEQSSQKVEFVYVAFICPMENGLYRLKLSTNVSRLGIPHPLIDGVVLSADLLSSAVRQTALSIALRRRLDQDGYVQPFVRRRQKIQEFGAKFSKNLQLPEFLSEILTR